MASEKRSKKNYQLIIYQGAKDREDVKVHLLENGKTMKPPTDNKFEWIVVGGRGKDVAKLVFQLVQYARREHKNFKEAWLADEPWFE